MKNVGLIMVLLAGVGGILLMFGNQYGMIGILASLFVFALVPNKLNPRFEEHDEIDNEFKPKL